MTDKKPATLEEFIEGANSEKTAKLARRRPSKKHVLLMITGKINRDNCSNPTNFCLKKNLKEEVDKYCAGSQQSVLNYLIRRGLDDLIKTGIFIMEEEE